MLKKSFIGNKIKSTDGWFIDRKDRSTLIYSENNKPVLIDVDIAEDSLIIYQNSISKWKNTNEISEIITQEQKDLILKRIIEAYKFINYPIVIE